MELLRGRRLLFSLLLLLPFWAEADIASGYTQNVVAERNDRFVEVFLFLDPPPKSQMATDVIFNRELSAEFRSKYIEKFGTVDTESLVYQNVRNMKNPDLLTNPVYLEQEAKDRHEFADFMVKRLSEWHVDHYFKSEPNMRPVYEAKEKLSKIEVEVAKEVKLNLQYSLSSNTLDVVMDNPWCDSKWTLEMDPKRFGPSKVEETRIFLSKQVRRVHRIQSDITTQDGIAHLEWVKLWKADWQTSLGTSSPINETGKSPRENRVSFGLGKSF